MMLDYPEDLSAQQRSALALWLLIQGWTPTTREVAERCGLAMTSARQMLNRIAEVVPVKRGDDGRWTVDNLMSGSESKELE